MEYFLNIELDVRDLDGDTEQGAVIAVSPFSILVPISFKANKQYTPTSVYASTLVAMIEQFSKQSTIYSVELEDHYEIINT